MPAVLALGLDPVFVDSKAMGGHSPALVRAFIDSQFDLIRAAGYEVESCLVDLGELLFERLLNSVHSLATQAKICFNSTPADSLEAVQRWV